MIFRHFTPIYHVAVTLFCSQALTLYFEIMPPWFRFPRAFDTPDAFSLMRFADCCLVAMAVTLIYATRHAFAALILMPPFAAMPDALRFLPRLLAFYDAAHAAAALIDVSCCSRTTRSLTYAAITPLTLSPMPPPCRHAFAPLPPPCHAGALLPLLLMPITPLRMLMFHDIFALRDAYYADYTLRRHAAITLHAAMTLPPLRHAPPIRRC